MKSIKFSTLLLTLLFSMMSTNTFAYNAEIDGIYYNLVPKGNFAVVTYKDQNYSSYSGKVEIPEKVMYEGVEYSVTSIGDHAFYRSWSLTSVSIPNSVTTIGDYAFAECHPSFQSITIPNSVTTIGNYAFKDCWNLTSVTIPNSVTSIGNDAFYKCIALTSIAIPNSVTSIGSGVFYGCRKLTSVTIPSSVTRIEQDAFSGCSALTSMTIPNSVTTIGINAFKDCSALTSVTIPNSVTSIQDYTFSGCTSLTSVTIPNSVTSIGECAFANCSKLEEIYCLAEKVPSTKTSAFKETYPAYMTLYVPASAINDYKTTAPWSEFGTFKATDGSVIPETPKCATPTISYANKKLKFTCETDGVDFVYEITDADIRKGYENEVNLSATYNISVYATKSGYNKSDVATATLVWTEAEFTVTTPTSAKAVKESVPVLISANNGLITVKGELDGQAVTVYSAEGKLLGSGTISGGLATVSTSLGAGTVAIVKIGQKAVKVVMR